MCVCVRRTGYIIATDKEKRNAIINSYQTYCSRRAKFETEHVAQAQSKRGASDIRAWSRLRSTVRCVPRSIGGGGRRDDDDEASVCVRGVTIDAPAPTENGGTHHIDRKACQSRWLIRVAKEAKGLAGATSIGFASSRKWNHSATIVAKTVAVPSTVLVPVPS